MGGNSSFALRVFQSSASQAMENAALTVIFDLEGTLVDCVPQTLRSWQRVLSESLFDVSTDQLQAYSGMDAWEMLARLLPGQSTALKSDVLRRQRLLYREQYLHGVQPFPEIREAFLALRRVGVTLAIASMCTRDDLAAYDRRLRLVQLADAVVCGDEVRHGMPATDLLLAVLRKLGERREASPVVVVGDSPYDAQAALALGFEAVGLVTGGFSREALLSSGHACVLERVRANAVLMPLPSAARSWPPR